ncbi:MAG: MlaD family protein [Betaproteobacteria bacterium]|nr:MlaD family protein [Betaproteobacteria bacterium]
MENRAHALVAGIFVIVLSIAILLAAMWLNGSTIQRNNFLVVSNESITGLNSQAAVHYRGVNIGKVEAINFDSEKRNQILIDISIDQNIILTKDVYAQLGYQGVTGLAYIQLNDYGPESEPLPHYGRIPMRRSLLDEVTGSGQHLLLNINELVMKMQNLLSPKNQAEVTNILQNIEKATKDFESITGDTQPLLVSFTELTTETTALVKHIDGLFEEIKNVMIKVRQEGGILDNLSHSTQELAVTVPELRKVTDGITRNSHHLDRVLKQLEENPQSLLFGRPATQPGPGEAGFVEPSERVND